MPPSDTFSISDGAPMLPHKAAADALAEVSLPEAEFLDEIQTKVVRVFLLAIHNLC